MKRTISVPLSALFTEGARLLLRQRAGARAIAGAFIAADDGADRMWAIHKRAMARGVQAVVPATVLAEVWRGGR